jgi:hypothetical protein
MKSETPMQRRQEPTKVVELTSCSKSNRRKPDSNPICGD